MVYNIFIKSIYYIHKEFRERHIHTENSEQLQEKRGKFFELYKGTYFQVSAPRHVLSTSLLIKHELIKSCDLHDCILFKSILCQFKKRINSKAFFDLSG